MTPPLDLDFVTLDVFTKTRYEGNPLAVVKVPASCNLTQDQKQAIAREFNLSETTFLHQRNPSDEKLSWAVDIFLTNAEIPFAGHPTIGTACHVLSQYAKTNSTNEGTIQAEFQVKAGCIGLEYDVSEGITKAKIPHDIHIHKTTWSAMSLLQTQPVLAGLFRSSNLPEEDQGRPKFKMSSVDYPIVSVVKGMTFILIELENETLLNAVSTTAGSLSIETLDEGWNEKSFVGSYFYVRLPDGEDGTKRLRTRMIEGALEDPATGSAASDLAGYLALKEARPGQTVKYAITQGVEMGRRSDIDIEVVVADDDKIDTIYLIGSAVQVMEGRLTV